jgi:hypothetical protein
MISASYPLVPLTGQSGGSLVYEHGASQAYGTNATRVPARIERDDR